MTLTLELAGLTGLDAASVAQQVMPHLDTYTDPEPLRVYLESLVGSSVTARSFIQNYLITRFGSVHRHRSHRASPVPAPSSSSGSALGSVSQPGSNRSSNKGKARQAEPTEAEALGCLNPEELAQVNEIDRGLKLLSLPEGHFLLQKAKCFCQGRRHPLSSYARICSSCGLVLCSLNLPSRPCPSCLTGPLLSPQQLFSLKTAQLKRRGDFLAEGRERFALAQQVDHEERQRMTFPSLADRANGVGDVQHRINNAYTENDTRRVLSLDLKTKKVSSTTTRKKQAGNNAAGGASGGERDLGLNDLQGWIDPTDDGYARQVKQGKAPAVPSTPAPPLIHYVSREQDDLAPPEEDEGQGSDGQSEGEGQEHGASKEGQADRLSAAEGSSASKHSGPSKKGKGKQTEEGQNDSSSSQKRGKGKSKVPGQA